MLQPDIIKSCTFNVSGTAQMEVKMRCGSCFETKKSGNQRLSEDFLTIKKANRGTRTTAEDALITDKLSQKGGT